MQGEMGFNVGFFQILIFFKACMDFDIDHLMNYQSNIIYLNKV